MDGPADAAAELAGLLEYNGIQALREGEDYRFLFSSHGIKWEVRCCPTKDGAVMIYGTYLFRVTPGEACDAFCRQVNARVRYGAMFLQGDRLLFRTGADLFDTYSAYETLGRALEYNAGVMARFYVRAAALATTK